MRKKCETQQGCPGAVQPRTVTLRVCWYRGLQCPWPDHTGVFQAACPNCLWLRARRGEKNISQSEHMAS